MRSSVMDPCFFMMSFFNVYKLSLSFLSLSLSLCLSLSLSLSLSLFSFDFIFPKSVQASDGGGGSACGGAGRSPPLFQCYDAGHLVRVAFTAQYVFGKLGCLGYGTVQC